MESIHVYWKLVAAACAGCWLLVGSNGEVLATNEIVFPGEHWETRSPAQVGLNETKLVQFAERVGGDGCIVRNGYLIKNWGDVTRHKDWASAAKPVLSTLLLLAVQEGRIPSVDGLVKETGWNLSAKDSAMTFRHLANMVSGYGLGEMPGTAWGYNDYAIQLYAKSLERIYGGSLDTAFRSRMSSLQFEDGEVFGARNATRVTASSRDFARLGWLWLNRGKWQGRQLLDSQLFDDCFRVGVPAATSRAATGKDDYLAIDTYGGGTNQTPWGPGVYGFNLWFNEKLPLGQRVWPALPDDAYQANGMWNRDTLTIIPSWQMVIASRGAQPGAFEPGNANGEYNQSLQLIAQAIQAVSDSRKISSPKNQVSTQRWHPHDWEFRLDTHIDHPFQVKFSATVTSPNGKQFLLPGFYDGDNVWKLRVSADELGMWKMVTHSDQPQLNGKSSEWNCVENSNPRVHGKLHIDAEHPQHFVYEDRERFFMLAYECDWLWALDWQRAELRTVHTFLDRIAASGFNYLILNTYAHDTRWRAGTTGPDDFGPPPMYAWGGSNASPDHSRLNTAYWQHYDRIIHALFERGMVAHVMLKVYNKQVQWPSKGSSDDELFFRSMIARYSAYPNIVWDFSKEAHNEKNLDYKLGRLKFIRQTDPYRHLITTHDDTANYDAGVFDQTNDFRCDQQHSRFREFVLNQRKQRAWPIVNVEFGYEQGPAGPNDKTYRIAQTPEELSARAWEISMAGGYTAYYYTYTAWDVLRPGDQPQGYAYFRLMRQFFESTNYWLLEPDDQIVPDGWVLANPGQEYVIYRARSGRFEATLPKNQLGYVAKWFHPLSGSSLPAAKLSAGRQSIDVPSQWQGPAVLHIRAGKDGTAFASPIAQLSPIDISGFGSGIHHWRNLRDESRFIQVEPDQRAYDVSQVHEIVKNILLLQRRNGGWPKDYDMTAVLSPNQLKTVNATHARSDTSYDNGNIHSQVEYLARAVAQVQEPAWQSACERGFDFMLKSQYASGGIPQRFPNATDFHAHITFNDGVMMGVLNVMQDAAGGAPHFAWLDSKRRDAARRAVQQGVACILRCQIRSGGQLTGWCQQHDERTFTPRPARTFEPASICPQETTEIIRFLMRQSKPSREVVLAIEGAISWLKKVQINGIRIEKVKSTRESFLRHDTDIDIVVVQDASAKPIWARHYEIGTNRPIFCGRDGVLKAQLSEIERERRTGTAWYGGWPLSLLSYDYPQWRSSLATDVVK